MKLKSMLKYSLQNTMKSYIIYYIIMFLIINLGMILTVSLNVSGGFGGMDVSTLIYVFIIGILLYRENISMGIQNGVSRKTYFFATVMTIFIFSVLSSAADLVLNILGNIYEVSIDGFAYNSMYEQRFGSQSGVIDYVKAFFMQFSNDSVGMAFGLMVSAIIYRLNKALKIIIPILFYLLAFIGLPALDYAIFDGVMTEKLLKMIIWASKNSWNITIFGIAEALILMAITYLFIRRVQIKDRK